MIMPANASQPSPRENEKRRKSGNDKRLNERSSNHDKGKISKSGTNANLKHPFDIDEMMRRIRRAVEPYPKAVLFELAERGFGSPFQILVACIITIRTLEEVSLPTALKLFADAPTAEAMAALAPEKIDELIRTCTFHKPKSQTIHKIARRVINEFGGKTPCDFEGLTKFAGVGPKCANLTLGIACQQPTGVPVDIHVHRVVNRWGYVTAATPEKTMVQLQPVLPRKYWLEINKLLVPFGKKICTGRLPHCSTCPVLEFCRQHGVTNHR
jgi:endonuclease III